ncbi:MAG: hypothetical protein H0T51_06455 [Pirellulales bacterium]|nr:hypothetical protein [Pirellulales bacterium]
MADSRSAPLKAAWERARVYAAEHGISVRKARSILAKLPAESKPKPAKPASKPKPRSAQKSGKPGSPDLAAAERALRRKYPHIVQGSIRVHDNGPHKGRRTIEIVCQHKGCQNKRRIHTSDAFQVELCNECTKIVRQQRRAKANKKAK